MKKHLLNIALILAFQFGAGQLYTNADSAFLRACIEKKPVFLIFSGSDWCPGCIRFEKKILDDSSFLAFAKENLVVLRADFPQRKKLPKDTLLQNEHLAELYNPKGQFPSLVIISPDKAFAVRVDYENQTPAEMISTLRQNLSTQHADE